MTDYSTASAFSELLEQEVKGLSSYLVEEDYTNSINDALTDTGFSFPLTDSYKIKWVKDRAKRHLFFYLWSESAAKFKVDQINLQHRFDHYGKLIDKMDKDWQDELENNPHKFAGVSESHLFGSKIDAGFAYESQTGIDLTYVDANKVGITPEDTD